MPRPSKVLKNPAFSSTKSTLTSVAKSNTPKALLYSYDYIMKIGEKMRKNLPERILPSAMKIIPKTPKKMTTRLSC